MSKSGVKDTLEKQADGETDQSATFMRNTMVSGTMVSGEASETDDEEDDEVAGQQKTSDDGDDLESEGKYLKDSEDLNSEIHRVESEAGSETKTKRQKIVYKFDSPFHRKLRERNLVLRSDLVEGLTQCYNSAGAKLESSKFHLIRAQTTAQDVSHSTAIMLEDLTHLSTLLESVLATEKLIPLKTSIENPPDNM
ncbi:uncharacterized protein [Montipora foliosa]|uniref:uncharacterized protein n=1 Tax=Montipora foliosa TaxID=591990 RepID=UPI0035F18CF3